MTASATMPCHYGLPSGPWRGGHCQDSFFFLSPLPPLPRVSGAEGGGISSLRLFCKVFVVICMPPE